MELEGSSSKRCNNTLSNASRERKRRKESLERMRVTNEVIKAASAKKDHLSAFPSFHHFHRDGLSLYLESGSGAKLSSPVKRYIQDLLKDNMEEPYGLEWSVEEKVKRKEMSAPEARYIFVYEALSASPCVSALICEEGTFSKCQEKVSHMVGFVHYRFVLEEDMPVLYLYELQLKSRVHGKGLGAFLMHLVERIALENHMDAIMLTVQKANVAAMNFYTDKLRYRISATSPSRVDPLIGSEQSYEILCKTFDDNAKAILEEGV